uniref:Xylanase inhibitor C-terminal domain-containing protein n=1 Tax=Lactuca sativa TaxID=4236 RepID=A0A9R1WQN9_LACSA|nr:hypothetical protein LSAT_V11C100041000 [Lactuca sativa]
MELQVQVQRQLAAFMKQINPYGKVGGRYTVGKSIGSYSVGKGVGRGYYSINLHTISFNGKTLSIDPSVFAINDDQARTIVDSGITLAYLTEEAYTLL